MCVCARVRACVRARVCVCVFVRGELNAYVHCILLVKLTFSKRIRFM